MKIGILTLPLHYNYGGILQAYALQQFLEKLGHEAYLLEIANRKQFRLRLFKKFLMGINKHTKVVNQRNLDRFVEREFVRKTKFHQLNSLGNVVNDYGIEAVIVGSDQVWRKQYIERDMFKYFLDFVPSGVKKIAFACSFGTDEWDYNHEESTRIKNLLSEFTGISSRETSGVSLLLENLSVSAEHLLDPTLLLSAQRYRNLTALKSTDGKGLFCYVLDQTQHKKNIINLVSDELNQKVTQLVLESEVNSRFFPGIDTKPSVSDWLSGFYNARFVITDSFHGCIFSIIFQKPFIAIGNAERGLTRFESLLTTFNLNDRLVGSPEEITAELINKKIDWSVIQNTLDLNITKSQQFIRQSLEIC